MSKVDKRVKAELDDKILDAAIAENQASVATDGVVVLPDNTGSITTIVAAAVTAVICFLFADVHYLTTKEDYAFLAVIAGCVFYTLSDAYKNITTSRANAATQANALAKAASSKYSSSKKDSAAATTPSNPGAAAMWEGIFQTNFWFFIFLGFLTYAIVPQFLDFVPVKYAAWVHAGVSTIIPCFTTFATGRGYF